MFWDHGSVRINIWKNINSKNDTYVVLLCFLRGCLSIQNVLLKIGIGDKVIVMSGGASLGGRWRGAESVHSRSNLGTVFRFLPLISSSGHLL